MQLNHAITMNSSRQTKAHQENGLQILSLSTLKPARNKPLRIQVTLLDGRTLLLAPEIVIREKLAAGKSLPDEQAWLQLAAQQAQWDARTRLIAYLTTRRKSQAEADQYLRRHGFPEEARNHALEAALALGYLNDQLYAQALAQSLDRGRKQGPRAIQAALRQKGVAKDHIDPAVEPLTPHEIQYPKAYQWALRRWESWAKTKSDPTKNKKRLIDMLLRRGYSSTVAYKVLQNLTTNNDDTSYEVEEMELEPPDDDP
jgi:regulatory protein